MLAQRNAQGVQACRRVISEAMVHLRSRNDLYSPGLAFARGRVCRSEHADVVLASSEHVLAISAICAGLGSDKSLNLTSLETYGCTCSVARDVPCVPYPQNSGARWLEAVNGCCCSASGRQACMHILACSRGLQGLPEDNVALQDQLHVARHKRRAAHRYLYADEKTARHNLRNAFENAACADCLD